LLIIELVIRKKIIPIHNEINILIIQYKDIIFFCQLVIKPVKIIPAIKKPNEHENGKTSIPFIFSLLNKIGIKIAIKINVTRINKI
jgi:hypothetical protein